MSTPNFQGGEKLTSLLQQYSKNLDGTPNVSVGFFSGSTESKSGLPSAYVALLNEYGSQDIVTKKDGTTSVRVTPPRPFFREMIRDGEKHWGEDLGGYLKATDMEADKALTFMGQRMQDELKDSIALPRYAPLAPSTISKKGSAQTLIDTRDMQNAVSFQVDE